MVQVGFSLSSLFRHHAAIDRVTILFASLIFFGLASGHGCDYSRIGNIRSYLGALLQIKLGLLAFLFFASRAPTGLHLDDGNIYIGYVESNPREQPISKRSTSNPSASAVQFLDTQKMLCTKEDMTMNKLPIPRVDWVPGLHDGCWENLKCISPKHAGGVTRVQH